MPDVESFWHSLEEAIKRFCRRQVLMLGLKPHAL